MSCLSRDGRIVVRRSRAVALKLTSSEYEERLEATVNRLNGLEDNEHLRDIRIELLRDQGSFLCELGRYSEAFNAFVSCLELAENEPEVVDEAVKCLVGSLTTRLADKQAFTKAIRHQDERCQENPTYNTLIQADAWNCSSCFGLLCDPISLPCGHTYCRNCLPSETPCQKCGAKWPPMVHLSNVLVTRLSAKYWNHDKKALTLRTQGNQHFAQGRLLRALECYSKAIQLAPSDHFLHSNRSHVLLKLRCASEALSDADAVIALKPQWAKGHFRRGMALAKLQRYEESFVSLYQCLALEPSSAAGAIKCELERVLSASLTTKSSRKSRSLLGRSPSRSCSSLDDSILEVDTYMEELSLEVQAPRPFPKQGVDSSDFECALCLRLLLQPVTTVCGHTYCKTCLDRSLDHSPACPMCKADLGMHLAHRWDAVNEFIDTSLRRLLPADFSERQRQNDAEMIDLAGAASEIPVFVCTMSFPSVRCPLHVFEPRYRLMIRRCMEEGTKQFGMCVGLGDMRYAHYGTMLRIREIQYFPDGRAVVDTRGGRRFRIVSGGVKDGYNTAKVEYLSDKPITSKKSIRAIKKLHNKTLKMCLHWFKKVAPSIKQGILSHYGRFPKPETDFWVKRDGPAWMWWLLAILPLESKAQLQILSQTSLKTRLKEIQKVIVILLRKQFGTTQKRPKPVTALATLAAAVTRQASANAPTSA